MAEKLQMPPREIETEKFNLKGSLKLELMQIST